jgi:signal transduction histidine kinase
MRRPSALPIWAQVAALAVFAVVMSQAVAFAVVVLAPDPKPAGFSVAAAADALRGQPARTADGRLLRRRVVRDLPARPETSGSLDQVLRASLAETLDVEGNRVRVWVDLPRRRPLGPEARHFMIVAPERKAPPGSETRIEGRLPPGAGPRIVDEVRVETHRFNRDAGPVVIQRSGSGFTLQTNRLTFAPFSAALRLDDGRWATVEPPRGPLSPWQQRMLLALGISIRLLAPLVWWMARRLTRPIRVFAQAAERLGADPDAEPLTAGGPSEVRTAIHAFNDMQASLRGHIRQRTQTVAAIAHDLRTPLTRLRFRAEQAPEAVRARMVADIEEMDALIGQAMAYVRGEAPTDRSERFDLDALAADCAGGFSETGETVTFDGGGELPVEADPAALRRAIANLVANALKYGGAARVRAFAQDGRAIITIEDDGPGLPDDELEAVFEPFHRAERSRNRETGGAGLGLTVARQAARAHGGEVTVANRPGGGLRARLDLPLAV